MKEHIFPSPGQLGKNKEEIIAGWNQKYGVGHWQLGWQLRDGRLLDFEGAFWEIYVAGYQNYFRKHPEEAKYLTSNFSFAFDKDPVTHEQAFDPYFLYEKPGRPNQFHNVALNIALEERLRMPFLGAEPIQVRSGKPGTPIETWPAGWRWSPGRIPAANPEWNCRQPISGWWEKDSIEDLYQSCKVLRVRK